MHIGLAAALLAAQAGSSLARFQYPDCVRGPLANTTACDVKASPSARAAAVVRAMNITEKLANLVDASAGAARIGLPAYEWWSEALHGLAASPGVNFNFTGKEFNAATSFASAITMSAAFDDELIHDVATVISTEVRAFANAGLAGLDVWTPNINPYKDPRWGRGAETPGEDPLRIKGYVKALLSGLEGGANTRRVIATCKHYAAYDLERWTSISRHDFNAVVSSQDLSEYYLPPFQQCARDSNVGSIMCSYNALNGTPACASTYLMQDILRDHWGWKRDNNYVTSDCDAVRDLIPGYHGVTNTLANASAIVHLAGTDTVCGKSDPAGAYNQSLLTEATIDVALKRLYEGLVRTGYFNPANGTHRNLGWKDVNTPRTQALARRSAASGLVLTKNDGTLPLVLGNRTVALIGHWIAATQQLLGPYSGVAPYYHSPLAAAQARNLKYVYATGPVGQNATNGTDTWTANALAAASKADVVLYFGGTDLTIAAEGKDRYSIAWPGAQLALLGKLAALGKPTVVVELGDQSDDSPLLANKNISAIVWAGYPGQDGGNAVFDVLTGVTAPAGRLPVTQYASNYTDLVPLTNMDLRPGAGNPGRTYRWFNGSVLPFGHGLHYTTFNLSLPTGNASAEQAAGSYPIRSLVATCKARHLDLCPFPAVPVSVTNTGKVVSDFVVLGFLAGAYGPQPYPIKTLAAYTRLKAVKPGATVRAELAMNLGALARVDTAGNSVLYPGTYELLVDVPTAAKTSFVLTGEPVVLDKFPQPK